jgi:NAD(P)-dependent dehydrogenase (short-subunit alcohol dehydrogenase family)
MMPDDMCNGRQREILTHRAKIKRLTLERRKKENLRIRVNAVSPGPVKTAMAFPDSFGEKLTTRKNQGMPEELAGAYILLASDAGKNINGADIVVDGDMTAGFTKQVWNWVFGPG